jgi:methyltransferase (TIGR00027 family)
MASISAVMFVPLRRMVAGKESAAARLIRRYHGAPLRALVIACPPRGGQRQMGAMVTVHDTEIDTRGQLRRSQTAEIVCALRAVESRRAAGRRLIDDPYAHRFVASPMYRLLCGSQVTAALARRAFDRRYPGYLAIVLLRNRRHEQLVAEALGEGVGQVVLLGAGFDSTALRLDLGDATVYEVDAAPTQLAKRAVIERAGLAPRSRTRYVECDFERDSLPERLAQHGFDPQAPALVVWWGVSFFLTEDAVRSTVADVAALTAPGSRFAFDYVHPSVVDGTTTFPGALRARAAVIRRGEPYRFGLSPERAPGFVRAFGFAVEDNLSIPDLAARYGGAQGFPYRTDDFFGVITARRGRR